MGLTIDESPAVVSLASNPVKFKVTSDDYLDQAAAKYRGHFNISGAQEGDTISLTFNGQTYVFEFQDDFTPVPYKLPMDYTVGYADHASGMLAYFETNYFLSRNFTISKVGTDGIQFTALEDGAEWEIEFSAELASGSITPTVSVSGAAAVIKNKFIRADVFIEETYDSDIYTPIHSIENPFIDSGSVWFDLSESFEPYFRNKTELANINVADRTRLDNINKRYKVIFTEYLTGQYNVTADSVESAVLRIHKGGLKKDEFLLFNDLVTDYLLAKKKLLTWKPQERTIASGQYDHLYFLNFHTTGSIVKAKIKFYYTDNTNSTLTDETFTRVHDYETYCWNVSFDRVLALATIPEGFALRGYECFFAKNNDEVLTESTYFKVVESNYLDRFFFYENSYGVFETLRTDTQHSFEIEIEQKEYLKSLPGDAAHNEGEIVMDVEGYEEKFKGSTGAKSKRDILSLIDFLIAKHKFLKRGNRLIRVHTTTNRIPALKDDDFPYGFKFSYKKAYKNDAYSHLIGFDFDGGSLIDSEDEGATGALSPE